MNAGSAFSSTFTYHIVNIKLADNTLRLEVKCAFTYHIVNIKPLEEYNIVEDAEKFTYHIVNIKHQKRKVAIFL
ncbi:hypothetical protein QC9_0895 [Clostridioides difficile CD39]|nr:hypothetical protein QC9_0895 [Clostridioides difficile CD39]